MRQSSPRAFHHPGSLPAPSAPISVWISIYPVLALSGFFLWSTIHPPPPRPPPPPTCPPTCSVFKSSRPSSSTCPSGPSRLFMPCKVGGHVLTRSPFFF